MSKEIYEFSSQLGGLVSGVSMPELFLFLTITGILSILYVTYQNKYGYGLNHVPGPWLASLSNIYRLLRVAKGTAHLQDINLHRKYGSVVRLGPNMVSIGDPKTIQKIYGITANLPKSDFYPVNYTYSHGNLVPGIFATTDEGLHRKMKRPIAKLYSMSSVLAYEPLVEDTVRVMIDQLDQRFASTGEPCDLSSWLQFYAFDVISAATFSSRVGFLEKGEDVGGVMEGIWSRFKYFATIGQMPWLDNFWDKSPFINTLLPAKSSPIAAFAMNLTGKRLEELKENAGSENNEKKTTKKSDFLSKFLEVKANNKDLPDWYLTSWTISNMLAGSDTTAINLRAIFYFLLRHPHALQRVLDEIKEAEDGNRLSEIITYNESKRLKYLDACIKESGRLHPSIGLPLERVVPSGGLEINGHHFPGGTIIGINAWTCQRDYKVFGEDADEWKPERWLVDDARASEMSRAMLLFGSGHRSCIGKHISLIEIYKIVPQLFREFEFKFVHPDRQWTSVGFWAVRQTDMDVWLQRRTKL